MVIGELETCMQIEVDTSSTPREITIAESCRKVTCLWNNIWERFFSLRQALQELCAWYYNHNNGFMWLARRDIVFYCVFLFAEMESCSSSIAIVACLFIDTKNRSMRRLCPCVSGDRLLCNESCSFVVKSTK